MSTHAAIIEYLTDSGYPCYRGIWVKSDGTLAEAGMNYSDFIRTRKACIC